MAKNLGGYDFPVNESEGGTNATTFEQARINMGLNPSLDAKTLGYTAVLADRGKLIHYTGAGGVTLALDAAATLTDGWNIVVRNDATSSITIDPDGGELINGVATLSVSPGQAITIYCTGAAFFTEGEATVSGNFQWNVALVNTVMSVNNGYVINAGGTLTMTLPPTSAVGDIVEVAGYSAGGWIIAQSDQTVHFGNMSTTPGAGGSLASTVQYDTIKLLSVTASPAAEWLVLTADGNITIV